VIGSRSGIAGTRIVDKGDGLLNLSSISVRWLLGGGASVLAFPVLFLLLLFTREDVGWLLLLIPCAGALVLGLALALPRAIIPGMMAVLISFPIFLDATGIPAGFMKLYYGDFLMVALIVSCVTRLCRDGWEIPRGSLNWIFYGWIALGCMALIRGYWLVGHEFDRAFGDFRRSVFYLISLIGFLVLYGRKSHRYLLERGLLAGCLVIMLEGATQAVTGQFYTRRFTDAAHILTKFELQFLAFGILLALARLASGRFLALWILLAFGGGFITLLGNFRSTWLSLLGGLAFIFLYLPLRLRLLMFGYGLVLILAAAGVLALAWNIPVADGGSTLGEDIQQKLDVRATRYDPNVTWRIESYASAWELWKDRPILGQGLGVMTEFSAPTSTGGAQIVRGHRVHNSFLWVLMSFGVVGAAVFIFWIASLFWRFHRALVSDRLNSDDRTLVLASGAFLVSFLISTTFEIFLESAPPVLMLSAVLALGLAAASAESDRAEHASTLLSHERNLPEDSASSAAIAGSRAMDLSSENTTKGF
jgi:hypothetical protein